MDSYTRNSTESACIDPAIAAIARIFALTENSIANVVTRDVFWPLLCPQPSSSEICPSSEVCPPSAFQSSRNVIAPDMSNCCPFLIPQGIGSFIPRSPQLPPLSIASFVILFRATPFRSCHLIMLNTRDIEAEFSAAQSDPSSVSSVVNTVSVHNTPSCVKLTVAHTASVVNSSSPVVINPKKSAVSAEKPSSAPETFGLTSENSMVSSK